ncbi:MAG: 30S ribosomal protein S20 [Chloroflexi bacterium]|nr:30S ribosomal protein S20 [Chloroflexota bacterium]
MATHKSAIKRHRQSLKRRERNRKVRGGVRKAIKRTRMLVAAGEIEAAQEQLRIAISRLDRAAKKGVIHPNNAARRKSRLTRLVNQAAAQQQ